MLKASVHFSQGPTGFLLPDYVRDSICFLWAVPQDHGAGKELPLSLTNVSVWLVFNSCYTNTTCNSVIYLNPRDPISSKIFLNTTLIPIVILHNTKTKVTLAKCIVVPNVECSLHIWLLN